MQININAAKCVGIDAIPITIEIDISNGIGIHIVGLVDAAIKESLQRTITALQAIGYKIPGKKIVVNLAPADLHKKGSAFDVPIALGFILASGQIECKNIENYMIMGELGLDASIKPISGCLPIVELALNRGLEACIFPREVAQLVVGYYPIKIYGVDHLTDVIDILTKNYPDRFLLSPCVGSDIGNFASLCDFNEILGQQEAKRGLEIAAAGGHNVIMVGTPGSGKSSLAKALASILPPMSKEEALVSCKIYSVSGKQHFNLSTQRPFRSPHYSASLASIIGGGNGENIQPGEISLAHNGILFLDEFTQIPRNITEALRAPIEDRKVSIARLKTRVVYPSSFMLVAAANPCLCGYYGDGNKCVCSPTQRQNYLSRLSGPIMDRIDIQIWMYPVKAELLVGRTGAEQLEPSWMVAERVKLARELQYQRFKDDDIFTNAQMTSRHLKEYCPLDSSCLDLFEKLINSMGLSARAYTRLIKLSQTIADLEYIKNHDDLNYKASVIKIEHILEAVKFRFLDKIR